MRMYDLIEKKKHGMELCAEEIGEMIRAYTHGEVPDYQMSAFLMAVYFRGMSDREIFDLTEAMATSGDTVDLSCFGDRSVDKHSTGGVGDKTTLIVAPIVAAAGGVVAKMSGRGLGHTGGTVDKLESFPGFNTALSAQEFTTQAQSCGLVVIGQSADLAPADKSLYALRDVTATVDSIPLIASSIMSKKLAAGTHSIVLDVKYGTGAFMRDPADAEVLADMMVKIGRAHGRNTAALISSMDMPLGHAIGNALEIREAVDVLTGKGPLDLRTVCLKLASMMIAFSCNIQQKDAETLAEEILTDGRAYRKFCEWISMQGGSIDDLNDPNLFGDAAYTCDVLAEQDGYISSCHAEQIGNAAVILGAGRKTKESAIDHRAGILLLKKPTDRVKKGEVVARLFTEKPQSLEEASGVVRNAITIAEENVIPQPLIYKIIYQSAEEV